MHPYKIEAVKYNEDGSLTTEIETKYAGDQEQARLICYDYNKQRQENGLKLYDVRLYTLAYKIISDKTAFFAQFQA